MENLKQLLEQRGKLFNELNDLKHLAEKEAKEARSLTPEQNERFDVIYKDIENINATVENLQRAEKVAMEMAANKGEKKVVTDEEARYSEAFKNLILKRGNVSQEDADILQKRSQATSPGSAGGFTIPELFSNEIAIAMKAFGGVRDVARILSTGTGADLPWPKINDTANKGEILAENTASNAQALVFGSTTLKAFKYTSKSVVISNELLQDTYFNMQSLLVQLFAERLGRATNEHYTTGNGTTQPQGLVLAADGTGVSNAAQTGLNFNDLINLKYSLDQAYRMNAKFMLNDQTIKAIVKLSIGTNYDEPLWQASYREGQPALILGHEYIVNNDMANIGAGNVSVLFGKYDNYIVRDVMGMQLAVGRDVFYDSFKTGFVAFLRTDGRFVGNTGEIKKLTHAT